MYISSRYNIGVEALLGQSNEYYSESVDFCVEPPQGGE